MAEWEFARMRSGAAPGSESEGIRAATASASAMDRARTDDVLIRRYIPIHASAAYRANAISDGRRILRGFDIARVEAAVALLLAGSATDE